MFFSAVEFGDLAAVFEALGQGFEDVGAGRGHRAGEGFVGHSLAGPVHEFSRFVNIDASRPHRRITVRSFWWHRNPLGIYSSHTAEDIFKRSFALLVMLSVNIGQTFIENKRLLHLGLDALDAFL